MVLPSGTPTVKRSEWVSRIIVGAFGVKMFAVGHWVLFRATRFEHSAILSDLVGVLLIVVGALFVAAAVVNDVGHE